MSTKTRLVKLEEHAAMVGKAAAKLIVAVGDQEGEHVTSAGTVYTNAEWEAWKAANTTDQDTVIQVCYEAQPPR